ncbi:MAG TPA: DUF1326 domain-containing protein [Vicinamibacterales bacterium]|jgi:hypothetical protein
MKQACAVILAGAVVGLGAVAGLRAADPVVRGDYVEARTSEVFTGPCIMGSEGEVSGKEAIMAWRVSRGAMNGVALDGLSIVAVVAADRHLSMHEFGAPAPKSIKSVVMVDSRATDAQQRALVALARSLAPAVITDVVATKAVPITFRKDKDGVEVAAGAAKLDIATEFEHPATCGAARWFGTLSRTDGSKPGLTRSQEWSGSEFGSQWTQYDRKSSFFGTFSLTQ